MDTPEKPKRRWWRKKRWLAAGLFWLGLGYVLSEGPALYAVGRGWLPIRSVSQTYRPVEEVADLMPLLSHARQSHRRWWNHLGSRQRTRIGGVSGTGWEIAVSSDVDQQSGTLTTRDEGATYTARIGGREIAAENGRRLSGGGVVWDGPITLDGRPVAALPKGTRRLSIGYFDDELSVEADGEAVEVQD